MPIYATFGVFYRSLTVLYLETYKFSNFLWWKIFIVVERSVQRSNTLKTHEALIFTSDLSIFPVLSHIYGFCLAFLVPGVSWTFNFIYFLLCKCRFTCIGDFLYHICFKRLIYEIGHLLYLKYNYNCVPDKSKICYILIYEVSNNTIIVTKDDLMKVNEARKVWRY